MRSAILILSVSVAALVAAPAYPAIRLCLSTEADAANQKGMQRIVANELARHKSHVVVEKGCESALTVRFFVVDGVRYLTAQINQEVPVRLTFHDKKELNEKLSEVIALVLDHDPVSLTRDIQRYSRLQRAVQSILKRGQNQWGIEFFQVLSTNGHDLVSIPGGALSFSRGADHFQAFARLYLAGTPGQAVIRPLLKTFSGADGGLTYELDARANSSLYVSAGAGVQLLHFEGRVAPEDPNSLESAIKVGGALFLRAGLKLLRSYDFGMDLFTMGYLPLFNTRDPDSTLIDSYTPSLLFGLGIRF